MTTITNTIGAGAIYNNTALPGGGANMKEMSPDALMAFLQTQLSGTDDQMNRIQASMTQQQNTSDAINSLMEQLNLHSGGINSNPNGSGDPGSVTMTDAEVQAYRATTDKCFNDAIDAAGGPTTTAGGQLLKAKQQFDNGLEAAPDENDEYHTATTDSSKMDKDLSATDISNVVQSVKTTQTGMSSDSQMGMIDLQSIMSSRQTFIQLATNMMQGLNDATKAIATNVGH